MAKSASKERYAQLNGKESAQAEFVNYELTVEEKKRLKGDFVPTVELADVLLHFADGGYKVTLKWDDYSKSYACFVMRSDGKAANAGAILTGRGGTPANALIEAAFKHYVLFEGDWPIRADKPKIVPWDLEE